MTDPKRKLEELLLLQNALREKGDHLWTCVKPYRRKSTALARAWDQYREARDQLAHAQSKAKEA